MTKDRECIFCGTILDEERNGKYTCEICERKVKILKDVTKADSAMTKLENVFKKYLKRKCSYRDERDIVVKKILENDFVFNSVEEMCFAMQLEKENIKYIPNYKIGKYKVDFFLPNLKRIVEIDGELYHSDKDRDYLRERSIMHNAGEEFEIIRIPASYVPKYTICDLKEMIEFIVYKRNFEGKFRDTSCDKNYLGEYLSLRNHLRRYSKWQQKIT